MLPLVKKLVQLVKSLIPLVPIVQMLPTNGTIGRTPNTRIAFRGDNSFRAIEKIPDLIWNEILVIPCLYIIKIDGIFSSRVFR